MNPRASFAALLLLGSTVAVCPGHEFGQRGSVLRLEAGTSAGRTPFRNGDALEIHEPQSGVVAGRHVVVLDVQHWPWVLVKTPQGEAWVNFDHVYSARHAGGEK